MRKRRGSILIELLCAVALMGLFLSYAVLGMGDVQTRLRQRQVELGARRLIMDARGTQEYNMFSKGENILDIIYDVQGDKYIIRPQKKNVVTGEQQFYFADFGCEGVALEGKPQSLTEYKPTSSVDDEKLIRVGNMAWGNKVTINLQPVTGRIELAAQ